MSKTLGNGIDPLKEIDKYGPDPLRYALVTGIAPGSDQRYQEQKVEAGRNLINKIWNAFRFAVMNFDDELDFESVTADDLEPEDGWILSELDDLVGEVTTNLDHFELGLALEKIVAFFWNSFCDWYIELIKPRLAEKGSKTRLAAQYVLNEVLVEGVTLLHPFMPFFTEAIYSDLVHQPGDLIHAEWPRQNPDRQRPDDVRAIRLVMEAVRACRAIRVEMNVPAGKKARLILVTTDTGLQDVFRSMEAGIVRLAMASELLIFEDSCDVPEKVVSAPVAGGTLYIPLDELVDVEKERKRLTAEQSRLEDEIERTRKKLENAAFVERAPTAVVEKEREKESNYVALLNSVLARLSEL